MEVQSEIVTFHDSFYFELFAVKRVVTSEMEGEISCYTCF